MKVGVSGIFHIQLIREGEIVKDIKVSNSLTARGAIDLVGRFMITQNVGQEHGWRPVEGLFSLPSIGLGVVMEDGFITLDRLDRYQYYDQAGDPHPSYGKNLQWHDSVNQGNTVIGNIDSLQFSKNIAVPGATENIYPTLNTPLPSPFTPEATYVGYYQPGSTEWRGVFTSYGGSGLFGQRCRGVVSSAVLPDPLVIHKHDTVRLAYTLKLTPTFV